MSEKLRGPEGKRHPDAQDEPEASPVKEEWLDGFIEGASRFPQGYFAISLYTGRALLKADEPNFQEFRDSKLSHEQTEHLAMLAERRHAKGKVEIQQKARVEKGNTHKPAALHIEAVWKSAISYTRSRLQEFARILTNRASGSLEDCVNTDSTVLGKLRQVIQVHTEILSSPLGVELSKRYVPAVLTANKYRLHAPSSPTEYEKLKEVRNDIDKIQKIITNTVYAELLGVFPEEKYPTLARKLVNVALTEDWPQLPKGEAAPS